MEWQRTLGRSPAALRQLFQNTDLNGDDHVGWWEFADAKMPPVEADYFQLLDVNDDVALSAEEFAAKWHATLIKAHTLAADPDAAPGTYDPDAAFRAMDSNSDQVVSSEEFQGLKRPREDQLRERKRHAEFLLDLFNRLDRDSDGRVTAEE